ncbi:MAG: hypothetical protein A2V67_09190 [Deltaproteobacteria bacterium RBG_13_61_14]|nr:MAG: hypothetical protein A2V67_09190 [Deltaproteobacteria bacterium RBG_13_61_14]
MDSSKIRTLDYLWSARPLLKYYYADEETTKIINHNIKWISNKVEHPLFQFAYLMLPTLCNQRCRGCFTGQDKNRLPPHLSGPFYSTDELHEILSFLRDHGVQAVVYGGGGELFTWEGAFGFLELIVEHGLSPVVFTNGTLLSARDISRLNSLGTVLIISLRDTVEQYHNSEVQINGFRRTIATIERCMQEGMHYSNRLAVEVPVTKENEDRIINDFLPIMRALHIVPMIEEYIQILSSHEEKSRCHTFAEARTFFQRVRKADYNLGLDYSLKFGQRMVGQPQCRRPLYSFAVYPNGDIMDCPSHSTWYGNFKKISIHDVIYSALFRKALFDFKLCACSVFYTETDAEVPSYLPEHLEILR